MNGLNQVMSNGVSRKIITVLILGMVFIGAVIFAQETNNTTTTKQELRTRIQEERAALQVRLKEERTGIQETIQQEKTSLREEIKTQLQNLKTASPEERQQVKEEIQLQRQAFKENIQTLRQNLRENAKELRESFRERITSLRTRVHIAAAHGKGLRMFNRFRSAIARFDHILGRMELRLQKLEERDVDTSSVTPLIEEAKNMKVEAEATLETLKAKYESLLEGENPRGVGEEAKQIAKELKIEAQNLHAKLREIVQATKALVPASASESE